MERISMSSLVCCPILISLSDSAATLLERGWQWGFWVRGLMTKLLRKVETLPYFLFCGCSSSGRSSRSTSGGSLNSSCRFDQSFHVSRGSTTGSLQMCLYFLRKSGTFSTAIIFCRCSRNMGQLTYRQLYCLPSSSYSSGVLSFSLERQQSSVAISQYPGRMANSSVERPWGVMNLQSAPCSNKQRTTRRWLRLTAAMRGVSPFSVGWLTAASHCSIRKAVVAWSPLQAARQSGVILVFSVSLWLSKSGRFSSSLRMFAWSFRSTQQSRYSRSEQVIAKLFAAPIPDQKPILYNHHTQIYACYPVMMQALIRQQKEDHSCCSSRQLSFLDSVCVFFLGSTRLFCEALILTHFSIFSMVARASSFSLHWSGQMTRLIFWTPLRTLKRWSLSFSLVEYFLPQSTMYLSMLSQEQFSSRLPKHRISFFSLSLRSAYHSLQRERMRRYRSSKRCLALQSSLISISDSCLLSLMFLRLPSSSFSRRSSLAMRPCSCMHLASNPRSFSFITHWFLFSTRSNCSRHFSTENSNLRFTSSTDIPPNASSNRYYHPSLELRECEFTVARLLSCRPWHFSSISLMQSFMELSLALRDQISSVLVRMSFSREAFSSLRRVNSIFRSSMIQSAR